MLLKSDNTSGRKTLQISHNFMQWPVVNTLFQEKKKHHNPKDGSKEHQNWGRIRSCNQSLNRDNTHSWVRITHGSNRCVMNLNNNETEIPEVQLEEYA